jgi:hypothetical protein
MNGVYLHCSKNFLYRYLAYFDFHYSSRPATGYEDQVRARRALLGGTGKRLMHRMPHLATEVAA